MGRTRLLLLHNGPLFLFLEPIFPRLSDSPGEDVGLRAGSWNLLAHLKCAVHPVPAGAWLRTFLPCPCAESALVCVPGNHPHRVRVSPAAGSGAWAHGSPSLSGARCGFGFSPSARDFSLVVAVVVASFLLSSALQVRGFEQSREDGLLRAFQRAPGTCLSLWKPFREGCFS